MLSPMSPRPSRAWWQLPCARRSYSRIGPRPARRCAMSPTNCGRNGPSSPHSSMTARPTCCPISTSPSNTAASYTAPIHSTRWVVEHKTSGDRRCRDETAFVPAKQAIPVARDPVIGPVADTPRQKQEYSRPGPAGKAGKNEDHRVGFEICVAIDNGDVSLGAGDIDGETGRQRRSASTLDRDETEPCAGIALNHKPDPPATKYADRVEQDEPIRNVVEAPRHPSLAHPILVMFALASSRVDLRATSTRSKTPPSRVNRGATPGWGARVRVNLACTILNLEAPLYQGQRGNDAANASTGDQDMRMLPVMTADQS